MSKILGAASPGNYSPTQHCPPPPPPAPKEIIRPPFPAEVLGYSGEELEGACTVSWGDIGQVLALMPGWGTTDGLGGRPTRSAHISEGWFEEAPA